MAITAWSAKVCSNLICLSLNGCTSITAKDDRSDALALAQQRHAQDRAVAHVARISCASGIRRLQPKHIVHMHRTLSSNARPAVQSRLIGPCVAGDRYRSMMCAETSSSPSFRRKMASYASQSSQALSTIALRTGPTSVGEEAITSEYCRCRSGTSVLPTNRGSSPALRQTALRSRWQSPPGRQRSWPVRSACR